MRTLGVFATALAAMLLLSSCAPSSTHADASHSAASQSASPTPTASMPAFLLSAQLDSDHLPDGVAERLEVDELSSRFQGDWDDHQVFLTTTSAGAVCVVTGIPGQSTTWISGCGAGTGVVTSQFPDGGTVKYVPMSSSGTPEGWTRLSDYIFAM